LGKYKSRKTLEQAGVEKQIGDDDEWEDKLEDEEEDEIENEEDAEEKKINHSLQRRKIKKKLLPQ
jgi:hypothetical protein